MARDPDELDPADVVDELDEEAVVDEEPPEHPWPTRPGLGVDLPEADVLDQWREVRARRRGRGAVATVRAWAVDRPGPIDGHPLVAVERPVPEPGPGEVRIRVHVCGVCRTDLHLAEGDLAPRRPGVCPATRPSGVVDAARPGSEPVPAR